MLLGVKRDASVDEIKKAYYKLAKQLHPDLAANKGRDDARRRFQAVSSAYEVLGDTQRRKAYDQFGHAGAEGGVRFPPPHALLP